MVTDPVRKSILAVLAEEGRTTRSRLVEALVADEDVPVADAQSLEIELHHNHLPKLAAGNYLEYDSRSGDIVLWKDPKRVRALIQDE